MARTREPRPGPGRTRDPALVALDARTRRAMVTRKPRRRLSPRGRAQFVTVVSPTRGGPIGRCDSVSGQHTSVRSPSWRPALYLGDPSLNSIAIPNLSTIRERSRVSTQHPATQVSDALSGEQSGSGDREVSMNWGRGTTRRDTRLRPLLDDSWATAASRRARSDARTLFRG